MTDSADIDWPREIWMAEREDHDQGVVQAVLSEHATVPRWEGDKERDKPFHRYVDADIHESTERYYEAKLGEMRARIAALTSWIADEAEDRGEADKHYPPERQSALILGEQ